MAVLDFRTFTGPLTFHQVVHYPAKHRRPTFGTFNTRGPGFPINSRPFLLGGQPQILRIPPLLTLASLRLSSISMAPHYRFHNFFNLHTLFSCNSLQTTRRIQSLVPRCLHIHPLIYVGSIPEVQLYIRSQQRDCPDFAPDDGFMLYFALATPQHTAPVFLILFS